MVGSRFSFFKKQIINSIKLSFQRTFVIVIAIFIGAMVSSSFLNIYFDIDSKMSKELKVYGANFTISSNDEYLSYDDYKKTISKIPRYSFGTSSAYLYGLFNFGSHVGVAVGVELEGFKQLNPFISTVQNTTFNAIDFDDEEVAYVGIDLANLLQITKSGQKIEVFNESTNKKLTLTVKGILKSGDEIDGLLVTHLKNVQYLLDKGDVINYANAIVDGDFEEVLFIADKISTKEVKANVITSVSLSEGIILEKIKMLMALIGIIILVISSTSVNTTLSSIIFARKKEIALHIALGASSKDIIKLFGWESFILAFFASVCGSFAGYYFATFLGYIVFNSSVDFRFLSILLGVICSMSCSFVAAYFPIKKALSIDIVENLRGE